MDKAKAAVGSFLHKDGKHDTTVHETVNPAVQQEHITKTNHEQVTQAVDREVHQDHHHTSIQPIQHKEVLPEEHIHRQHETEHRHISHGDDSHVKERLAAEAAQFKNTRTVGETQHTSAAAPTIAGEHVHHHVHENIQPVIQKDTIQPTVVHTTKPIHEVHQNEAKHHTATALPAVTMDEFKRQGGALTGREERTDAFQGEPRAVGGTLGGHGAQGTTSLTEHDGKHTSGSHLPGQHNTTGTTGSHLPGQHNTTGTTGSHLPGQHNTTGTSGSHLPGQHNTTGTTGSHLPGQHNTTGTTGSHLPGQHNTTGTTGTTGTGHKPTLMEKLNPKIDSNGDGKAGFMK